MLTSNEPTGSTRVSVARLMQLRAAEELVDCLEDQVREWFLDVESDDVPEDVVCAYLRVVYVSYKHELGCEYGVECDVVRRETNADIEAAERAKEDSNAT